VSVFQKQRVHPMPLKCANNHALVRSEAVACDGGHVHRVLICPMRMGNRPCGDVTVLPPFGPGCARSESDPRGD
jgi:hypothetical protein